MQFADAQSTSTAYLILRHLYDGDVIEWPIAEDHPQREVFAGLEGQGYVARWDRVWPLHDRYRLTEQGIAAIEAVYRPAGAEGFFEELRQQNLDPAGRRTWLQQRNCNPILWPLLHDPSTHWSTYATEGARYQQYVWEDTRPPRRKRPPPVNPGKHASSGLIGGGVRHHRPAPIVHHHVVHHRPHHQDVDLDREAEGVAGIGPTTPDYDVS